MKYKMTVYTDNDGNGLYRVILESEDGDFDVEENNDGEWEHVETFESLTEAEENCRELINDD